MSKKDKKIKCLACFDTIDSTDNRMNNPASFTKLSYVLDCFVRLGYEADILSASYTFGAENVKGSTRQIGDNVTLTTIDSMGRGNKLKNAISLMVFYAKLKRKLKEFVKDGDTLLVYHSLGYMRIIKWLKKHKNIKLLLEVEEIYGHVINSKSAVQLENRFFECADGYIFCTGLLEKNVNSSSKPYVIVHGTYKTEPESESNSPERDTKIHCVYAGTLDIRKGALNAINAAEFLDESYHIHILGYGSESDVAAVKKAAEAVSLKGGAKVTYDGVLSGKEYTDFLSRCSVGLCTQEATASFNGSSFPSKVLVYMANGLRVVSVRIPAIENSDVGEYMCFYDESSPEMVARAIKSIDLNAPYNGREIIDKLDEKFMGDLKALLNQF